MLMQQFKRCIAVLRKYNIQSVEYTIDSLTAQKQETEKIKDKTKEDVKKTTLYTQMSNDEYRMKLATLSDIELPSLQQTLKSQQLNNIFAEAKKITIARIVQCRKNMDQLKSSIQENELRVKAASKILMSIIKEIDKIDNEITLMEDCKKVYDFLVNVKNMTIDMVSDYEIERLFNEYTKGE